MISEDVKNSIKSILEGSPASLVSDYLESKTIRNSFGNPYPPNYIRDVINGVRENKLLEKYIYDAVAHYKKKYESRDSKRAKILASA